jgi:hypothetical protein
MRKLLIGAASIIASVGITAGVAAAQTAISNIGPDSDATVNADQSVSRDVTSDNDVNAENNVDATATSGDAENTDNNTGGDASSGNTGNSSDFTGSLTVDSSAADGVGADVNTAAPAVGDVSIDSVGPNSTATVNASSTSTSTVDLHNNLNVENNITQNASSGNATVTGNNTGGNATSGGAQNTSTSSITLSVTQ